MSIGYSQRLVEANKKASVKSLGVALGRLCISQGIPVTLIAEQLGVSRATIYNWFWGLNTPDNKRSERVHLLIQDLKRKK
jgi:transposase